MGVFDVVGPVMIGPSSSHTAGAARIGLMAREILKEEPKKAVITVYGSFAKTYKGHGTDRALVAGLLGFRPMMSGCARLLPLPKNRAWLLNFIGLMKKWTIPIRYASP